MPTYVLKVRNTSPITEVTVTADSREGAIGDMLLTAKPGEQMEVMSAVEVPAGEVAPGPAKK
jgi:hypothetical protein